MPNIRIKDIPTTASATSSTDFIGIDGSANGTRKLNAYSPTFGGNLTVSGTGNLGGGTAYTTGVTVKPATNDYQVTLLQSNSNSAGWGLLADTSGNLKLTRYGASVYGTAALTFDLNGAATFNSSTTTTVGGNLTVSGTGGIENSVSNGSSAILKLTQGGYSTWNIQNLASNGGLFIGNGSGTAISATTGGSGGVTTISGNLTVSGGTSANTNIAALRSNYTGGASAPYVSLFGFADETTGARIVGDVNGGADIGAGLKIQTRTNAGVLQDVISFPKNTNNTTIAGNLTVSGGTITSGTATLTLNSSANTVVLQSAGTTALTLDTSQNATFAGPVNLKNYVQSTITSGDTIALCGNDSTNTYYLGINYLNNRGTETIPIGTGRASWRIAFDDTDSTGNMVIGKRSGGAAANSWTGLMTLTQGGNATFTGSIAIGNTVQTAVGVASTHKVTISIGGSTYYLLATNV